MPARPTLTIPTPCHESWAAMTPAAQGRHCAACNKVVLDFTQKSDAEILALLRRVAKPCGRFRADQLQRPLLPPPVPAPRWRTWLAAAATVWGLRETSTPAGHAQQLTQPTTQATGWQSVEQNTVPDSVASIVVRGQVTDAQSHDALPGVTVLVKKTALGVPTQADGSFELILPSTFNRKAPVLLQVNFVGYVSQELVFYLDTPTLLTVALAPDLQQLSGELVIVGGVSRKSWPWHPRLLWNWARREFQR